MRATTKQLDSAAKAFATATDVSIYDALLTIAVSAINERENRMAHEYEALRSELIEKDRRIMEQQFEIEELIADKNELHLQLDEATIQYNDLRRATEEIK